MKLTIGGHQPFDYTAVYKLLLDKYQNSENCPALLMVDELPEPVFFRDKLGHGMIILDRNANNILRVLKKTIPKQEILLSDKELKDMKLDQIWHPDVKYKNIYSIAYQTCTSLQVDMPALYFVNKIPGHENLNGCAWPGNAPYVTEIFFKVRHGNTIGMLRTLFHEIRHVWQHKYHNDWFDDYFQFSYDKKEEYYMQKAEIDADAYAYSVLERNNAEEFVQDEYMTKQMFEAIRARMEEINATENINIVL